jgi:hypothetical protein
MPDAERRAFWDKLLFGERDPLGTPHVETLLKDLTWEAENDPRTWQQHINIINTERDRLRGTLQPLGQRTPSAQEQLRALSASGAVQY